MGTTGSEVLQTLETVMAGVLAVALVTLCLAASWFET